MVRSSPLETGLERSELRVRRCLVMKKLGFDPLGHDLEKAFTQFLEIPGVEAVRTGVRYDVEGVDSPTFERAKQAVFGEAPVADVYEQDELQWESDWHEIIVQALPGQYDQRADSAAQCLQLLTNKERPTVRVANIILVKGKLADSDLQRIKSHLINENESRETTKEIPETLHEIFTNPADIKSIADFGKSSLEELSWMFLPVAKGGLGLAMNKSDLACVQNYFRSKDRDPTVAEIRIIDMYWSDHCRHLTFNTELVEISLSGKVIIEKGQLVSTGSQFSDPLAQTVFEQLRSFVEPSTLTGMPKFVQEGKGFSLMDMALSTFKKLRSLGMLKDVEHSQENNAASLIVPVEFADGHTEEWLFMFKNETHNHPTQVEPFGGAATCLGGVIRDPLSGRSFVFMGTRITGSGDPRKSLSQTRAGRLPSRYITQKAAEGFSSYGNQIGVPTLQVREFYDEGDTTRGTYEAKRFEAGCVGGAVRRDQVVREEPKPGDMIILVGGRTGRDGIGGATGSSKSHDSASNATCGAEVQKGNAVEERKIQRLFKRSEVTKMIKRCNDFGAGGVANAIGELAEGISINLDKVPLKYQGLDGTEISLSESQERMAVVIASANVEKFIQLAQEENLEASVVAHVQEERALRISWKDQTICDIDRDFLEKGWSPREAKADIQLPPASEDVFDDLLQMNLKISEGDTLANLWLRNLQRINIASQRGLQQRFDSTVGANTVMSPFGGEYQLSPSECAVSRFPVEGAITGMAMSSGFNHQLSIKSPFHNGMYSVIESLARLVASGADYTKARLSLQNYFERLDQDPRRWGKAVLAHTGALLAQEQLVPSIGGKDSASGSFGSGENRIDVPFGLVSFAVAPVDTRKVIPSCFQKSQSKIIFVNTPVENDIPNFDALEETFHFVQGLIASGKVLSCRSIRDGGLAAALSEMSFGNKLGVQIENTFVGREVWFEPKYGGFVLELADDAQVETDDNTYYLGKTNNLQKIEIWDGAAPSVSLHLDDLISHWEKPLDDIFPLRPHTEQSSAIIQKGNYSRMNRRRSATVAAKPRVVVPVFPGTNCEYETALSFEREGAESVTPVFANMNAEMITASIERLVREIRTAQILVFAGGFSAGDEPDGSGKFIANVLRQERVKDSIEDFLKRDGLILGICNGFQALIKSGLLPKGKIDILGPNDPTLTHNTIGHYLAFESRHRVKSVLSPWMANFALGEMIDMPIAHGEGNFVAPRTVIDQLWERGQIPLQYVNRDGEPSMTFPANPNGSMDAIAALTNLKGNILGMMAHPERARPDLSRNIPGKKTGQKLFRAGVDYFKH